MDLDEDFLCPICKEYPSAEILQCAEGHIFCRTCFLSMLKLKPECATCRCYVDASRPIRNRLAEKKLALMPATCPNLEYGCNASLTRGILQDHLSKDCPYRMTVCQGQRMGCPWRGFVKDNKSHEGNCVYTRILPVLDRFSTELDKNLAALRQNLDNRLEQLEQRLTEVEETHRSLSMKRSDGREQETVQQTLSFRLFQQSSSTGLVTPKFNYWWTRTFQAFGSGWELAVRLNETRDPASSVSTTSGPLPFGSSASPSSSSVAMTQANLEVRLKPDTFYASQQQLRLFSIMIACLHPDPNHHIRVAYKYENIVVSPQRFLSEPCFLSSGQLRSFVDPQTGDITFKLVLKRDRDHEDDEEDTVASNTKASNKANTSLGTKSKSLNQIRSFIWYTPSTS